jgi:Ca2+-transporting ATPase
MTQHNLLVRVFEACETMSNANVIVTDKTGTLTANEMRVVEGSIAGVKFSLRDKKNKLQRNDDAGQGGHADGKGVKDIDSLKESFKNNKELFDILANSIAINSTAFSQDNKDDEDDDSKGKDGRKGKGKKDNKAKKGQHGQNGSNGNASHDDQGDEEEQQENEGPKFVGNKTESALLRMLEWDMRGLKDKSYADLREDAETVMLFPFSSDRKAMATAVKLKDGGKYRLYVKGAAEAIVELCTKRANLEGKGAEDTTDLDEKAKQEVGKLIEEYATRSLRTIAMAYRDYDSWPPSGGSGGDKVTYDDVAKDLILLAVPGIEDPLRSGVPDAVEKCHHAGVDVKMCTGDNILTAQAIGKQCSIYDEDNEDAIVISGSDWRKLSDEEKREKAPKISVMARSLPQDKETLVKALQDVGKTVGVTGDGTNDALALKTADVGFSMGQTGTEVAKEASDVVIMDDNVSASPLLA